ncbi:MAG: hypothetical protein RBR43_06250 [Desulfuromonadaceae bacterium]|nr:hypothetical protein [Desulfuromonas sp.]MDY0185462.1 hypothetical protein [Desulfuromonadaceae bacterium]
MRAPISSAKDSVIVSKTTSRLLWIVLSMLLLGADLIWTPHAPVSHLPQIGIYMLITLTGTVVVLGVTLGLRRLLQRGEDYYAEH